MLPHLYERYGDAFPTHLRGMFGIAVWDGRRSAAGARPRPARHQAALLRRVGDLLVFASELKSLLASGLVEPELDYEAIDVFLTFGFFVGARTPLARRLEARCRGTRLVVDGGAVRDRARSGATRSPRRCARRRPPTRPRTALLEELEESVRLRLMSDVPLGAMLSGGLDSSLIVALMARNMAEPGARRSRSASPRTQPATSSPTPASSPPRFGTDHHELELSVASDAVDLEDLVWHLDEPLSDLSALGFFALSRARRRSTSPSRSRVRGRTSCSAGYRKHQAAALVAAWNRLPRPAAQCRRCDSLPHAPARFERPARTLAAPRPGRAARWR